MRLWGRCHSLLARRWLLSLSRICRCLDHWIDIAPHPATVLILVVIDYIYILGSTLDSRLVHPPHRVSPEMIRFLGSYR